MQHKFNQELTVVIKHTVMQSTLQSSLIVSVVLMVHIYILVVGHVTIYHQFNLISTFQ